MGEQIEVQLECHSTPEAHPSPGESSVGSHPPSPALSHVSYVSHADLSVHSPLSNHSSPSHAHNEGRPSPTGSGSVYEPSQEPPEGYTDVNNAALKKVLDAHITPFTQLPETARAELMGSTCPDTVDVDSWAIAMSPEYYQQHFCNVHTIATLCSYLAVRPRDSAEYEGWTALAASGHVIFIHPSYSKSFIEHMGQHRPIEPAKTDFCITTSSLVVPMLDVIECLKEISCPTLRLVCYGQKRRITDYTVPFEPAQPDHYKASTNLWDIGVNVHSDKIFLFRPDGGRSNGVEIYPMVIPLSSDFGSCHIHVRYEGTDCKLKIYPLLVHKLKSLGGVETSDFKTHATFKARFERYGQILKGLEKMPPSKLGGYRIEATVPSRTLLEAKSFVDSTGFLDINSWIYPTKPQLQPFKLDIKVIAKEQYIQNAKAMIAAADSLPIWRGSNHMPVSKPKKMLLIDVAAALGWNASGWRATSSNAMYAWWNIWTEKIEPWQFDPILDHLTIRWNNFRAVEELTEIIRDNLPERKIPCQKGSIADGHWYHKDTTRKEKRFRLRCRLRSCRHSLSACKAREWYASLPHDDMIPFHVVGLEAAAERETDQGGPGNDQPALEVPMPSPTALPETAPCNSVFDFIRRKYPGPQEMQELLRGFKERGIQIPCPLGGPGEGHELRNAGGKVRFRLRCKFRKCKSSMELVPSQYWIKTLIEEGRLCRSLVGLPPNDDTVVNLQRPSSTCAIAEPAVAPSVPLPSHSPQPEPAVAPSAPLPSHSL